MASKKIMAQWLRPCGGIAIVLLLWQVIALSGLVPELLLPRPFRVAEALIELFRMPTFWLGLSATIGTWLLGSCLGTVAGVVVGFPLGYWQAAWLTMEPVVEFLRSLPSVVLVPLVALVVGTGDFSRFVSVALAVALIMTASSAASIGSARASYLRLACAWRLTKTQTLRHLFLPSTVSHLVLAARNAIPIGLVIAVAADMLVATESGLGKLLVDSLAVFNIPRFFAVVVVVGSCGYASALFLRKAEEKILHWRAS